MRRTIQAARDEKIVNNPRDLLARQDQRAQRKSMDTPHMDRAVAPAAQEKRPAPPAPSPLALSLHALDRIEAALARIENAAPACIGRDADLHRRHDALKASVAQSLAGLDDLLAARVPAEEG